MLADLKHATRLLLQAKGWTAVLLLSLALGIGVNTALFSAIDSVLLKTLEVPEAERLVRLRWTGENEVARSVSSYGYLRKTAEGKRAHANFSFAVYERLRDANQTLAGLFACAPAGQVNVVSGGRAELARAFLATGNYFQTLGIPAYAGRLITPEDDNPGASPTAMISYGYWERRFGKDPAILGRDVSINNVAVTIVGVTPPYYAGIQRLGSQAPDIHLPLFLDPQIHRRPSFLGSRTGNQSRLSEPTAWWLLVAGRMKPGVTPQQVEGNLQGTFQAAAKAGWDSFVSGLPEEQRDSYREAERKAVPELDVASASRGIYDPNPNSVGSISILGVVVVLVLLIVCANVANLLLSRVTSRQKEIAIRLSLGAGRLRLIRQLLTESVLLAVIGGALALLVAYWSRPLLPFGTPPPLDWRVFLFAAAISVLTGLAFGIIPALRATRVNLADPLKDGGRGLTRSRALLSKALLVFQVALSLALLIGAGLFLRTLQNLRSVPVGFDTENLLLVSLNPRVNRYDEERTKRLLEDMKEEFRAIPAVRSVSLSQMALLAGGSWRSSIYVQGRDKSDTAHMMTISPEFLETMGIPLVAGRNLTRRDDENAPRVALINEAAAQELFPGESPLGRRFGFSSKEDAAAEVVGVVRDVKYSSVREEAPPTVYQAYLQRDLPQATFELRTAVEAESLIPSVREAARRVDPNLPLSRISTQAGEVERLFSRERTFALAYSLFGGLALLLACVGLFGLMSYNVARRTNEMGIRLAVGAQRGDVVRMVLKESLLLVAVGLLIGLGAALAAGRLVASLLYGLAPTDPLTIALAIALMLLVAAAASYLPARRASRIDPLAALQYE